MIRVATIEDKEAILALADEHIRHVGELEMGGVDIEAVNALADYILTEDNGACFVYEKDGEIVGLLAGSIESPTLNKDRLFVEHLLVFKPGKGAYSVPIIKAVKQFVIDAELDGMAIGCMADAGERIFSLYEKLGFKDLERKYIWKHKK